VFLYLLWFYRIRLVGNAMFLWYNNNKRIEKKLKSKTKMKRCFSDKCGKVRFVKRSMCANVGKLPLRQVGPRLPICSSWHYCSTLTLSVHVAHRLTGNIRSSPFFNHFYYAEKIAMNQTAVAYLYGCVSPYWYVLVLMKTLYVRAYSLTQN